MKKRILSLALSLSLAISLFAPAYAAETKPVTPTPPEWIKAEDYVIFPDDELYLPENWAEIEWMREEARIGGAQVLRANGEEISDKWPVGYGTAGFAYEVGLTWLKCAENLGLDTEEGKKCLSHATRALNIAGGRYHDKHEGERYDETYSRISLVYCRALALNGSDYNLSTCATSLSQLLPVLGMTLEDFFDAPHMELITPETRHILTEKVNVYANEHGLPVYPSLEGYIQIFLDDIYISLDVPATMVNSRTMIPIRAVAEALGADVGWEEATRQVTLTRAGTTIVMTVDSPSATVDGESITMDVAPYISGGRTLIPVRYVAEFFGQKVDWDGENLRVYISEDKSVVGDSNLEAWALPMGAMLSWANDGSDPTLFGAQIRTAKAAEEWRGNLASGWGISSREDLISTVISMTLFGHDATFRSMAADVKETPEAERKAISEASGAWPYFMWAYTEELDEKWGDRGIMAWDLFRMSNILQWGYVAGYVTYEEALALLEPAATILCQAFSSWDEAYENYLDGYTWWARTSAEEWANTKLPYTSKTYGDQIKEYETQEGWQDWMKAPRGTLYFQMKTSTTHPDVPLLFDDSLFETGVIGVPEK